MNLFRRAVVCATAILCCLAARQARAQSFGVELHNTMMPASGGMAGASIADPQDLLSALATNPAAMTEFTGTQFQFGGGWAYADYKLNQTGTLQLPNITPFNEKSGAPGAVLGNLGMTRQFSVLGADAVFGTGLTSSAGGGVDFRGVPASNGTSAGLLALDLNSGLGLRLTDRLSVGGGSALGTAFFDGPFVGNGAMVTAYAMRAIVGAQYRVGDATSLGLYYQSKQNFLFEDAIQLELFGGAFDISRDIRLDLPRNIGFGIANRTLLDGNLLLAVDCVFKNWEDADLFQAVYRDQWVLQFGAQYTYERLRLRAGYAYAQNPLKPIVSTTAGGVVPPGGVDGVAYAQSLLAVFNQNRLSAGLGIVDVVPGLDFDLFAGMMLSEGTNTGPFTAVRLDSYWLGAGTTWRFGRYGVSRSTP